ncbi:MAG: UvrD-helicase domain-containing protein, partial [Acidobacteria bacterium]|nr:UvrD-helicase domain-containing protein [Acidobacteriota bacterium]
MNPLQLEAVTHRGGHCLVLAGAGSGKTRVLTHRIAWLIAERNIDPAKICAVTFTNKAAGEMRNRVRRLLGPGQSKAWLLTFHAMGLRLLREWTEEAFSSATGASGSPLRDAG